MGVALAENFAAIRESRPLDIPRQANPLHQPDPIPSEVGLLPVETLSSGVRKGVMIVVPTISESDESEEEVVVASVGRVVWKVRTRSAREERDEGHRSAVTGYAPRPRSVPTHVTNF
jgi:hypothetical protein